ncbi:MAG TPA: hypothetical protein PLU28_10145 [Petrotogaceae bacterium]|nr:hypothetical protein [Petrotogaceae bacterium]
MKRFSFFLSVLIISFFLISCSANIIPIEKTLKPNNITEYSAMASSTSYEQAFAFTQAILVNAVSESVMLDFEDKYDKELYFSYPYITKELFLKEFQEYCSSQTVKYFEETDFSVIENKVYGQSIVLKTRLSLSQTKYDFIFYSLVCEYLVNKNLIFTGSRLITEHSLNVSELISKKVKEEMSELNILEKSIIAKINIKDYYGAYSDLLSLKLAAADNPNYDKYLSDIKAFFDQIQVDISYPQGILLDDETSAYIRVSAPEYTGLIGFDITGHNVEFASKKVFFADSSKDFTFRISKYSPEYSVTLSIGEIFRKSFTLTPDIHILRQRQIINKVFFIPHSSSKTDTLPTDTLVTTPQISPPVEEVLIDDYYNFPKNDYTDLKVTGKPRQYVYIFSYKNDKIYLIQNELINNSYTYLSNSSETLLRFKLEPQSNTLFIIFTFSAFKSTSDYSLVEFRNLLFQNMADYIEIRIE